MKTVALNNRTAVRGFFVLAALAGLYYFRRQGGTVSSLVTRGTDVLGSARGMINRVAPSVMGQGQQSYGQVSGRGTEQSISSSAQI
jgi:hypothetical protein